MKKGLDGRVFVGPKKRTLRNEPEGALESPGLPRLFGSKMSRTDGVILVEATNSQTGLSLGVIFL
jgi:hypothetical protein